MSTLERINNFKQRTKNLALKTIKLYQSLPKRDETLIVGKQLLRSSTSVAANYRAACRARSGPEFFSKISIVVEEADETLFWLEILQESGISGGTDVNLLMNEYLEVLKIVNTIRHNRKVRSEE
ncbi:MAG TPA: four helix bundle protein [Saprospiraceae bacterium]|nr:four helix bundle protein [Saprospiraceae bacterium]HNT21892.1 four helix bundle protein [Saprospiraceae bacterium]